VSFGILGEKEPCCGDVVLNLGHQPYFAELAEGAAGVFKEEQVTNLISISPHCQDVFQSHYPDCGKGFKPSHYLSYLISLVEQDRLNFTKGFNHKVTVHDPCLLSRKADETQAIRTLLTRIPGIELIEMAHNMGDTLCCGGGGGRMWMETPAEERFADLRLKEAVQTDATILATACPYCVACLEDGAKNLGMADLQILDVAEILAGAI
jgi:Fe-S oxidoreductase